jgi:flagellar biosynthetic protein FlhB
MARPEQTEKPTPKRRGEARAGGRVARSAEVAPAFVLLAGIVIIHFGFTYWFGAIYALMRATFTHVVSEDPINIYSAWGYFARGFAPLGPILAIFFLAAMLISYAANVLQFGFLFTAGPLVPRFSKLNPLTGISSILISKQTLVSLAKQILKLLAVCFIIFLAVKDNLAMIYQSAHSSPHDWLVAIEGLIYGVALRFALFLVAMALLDYAYQRWQYEDSLKMSKAEVKDELRQMEGAPEAKQAVKQQQRAAARRRMMAAVPKATVVVTNPTHFACALEWDEVTMEAPVLTAKGADLMARRIRELAREHDVPLVENPTLARTLYYKVELDHPVPPELYAATAQVIAFVYRLKRKTIAS